MVMIQIFGLTISLNQKGMGCFISKLISLPISQTNTAPCPPKAPHLYRECSTNVILFSWSPTNSTAYYHALAMDSDGHVTNCITVDNSCYFTETVCGKTYSFYVSSIYSGGLDCNSGNTEAVVVKTGELLAKICKYFIFS